MGYRNWIIQLVRTPATTKWWVLADPTYEPSSLTNYYAPLAGGGPEDCAHAIPDVRIDFGGYVISNGARHMALADSGIIKGQSPRDQNLRHWFR